MLFFFFSRIKVCYIGKYTKAQSVSIGSILVIKESVSSGSLLAKILNQQNVKSVYLSFIVFFGSVSLSSTLVVKRGG